MALEVPMVGNRFVLGVGSAVQVPATIRSRCQIVRLGSVAVDEVASWLQRLGVEPTRARQAAVISDGRPGAARTLCADDKQWTRRQDLIDLAVQLADGDSLEVIELGERFTERAAYAKASPDDKRQLLGQLFDVLSSWFRDMLLLHQGVGARALYNLDQEPVLRRCSALYSTPRLLGAIEAVQDARSQVARNVNPRLVMVRLFLKVAAQA